MPKFFTVPYAEVDSNYDLVPRKRSSQMTEVAIGQAVDKTGKIKKMIGQNRVLVVTSGLGASQQCADLVSGILNAHQFKARVLVNPGSRGAPIDSFLSNLEKEAKKTGVFVIITNPENHYHIERFILTGLKKGELIDPEQDAETELDVDDDFDLFEDAPDAEQTFI